MSSARGAVVLFGDVVELHSERTNDPDADGFERYVGLEHLDSGDLRIRRWGDVADGTTFANVFRPGHVLFGKRRAYQRKVAVAEFSGVCSGDIYVLKPTGAKLLEGLLPYICQTDAFLEHAVGTSAGSLSPRTNWSQLSGFEFILPEAGQQQRILEAVSAAAGLAVRSREMLNAMAAVEAAARERFFDSLQNQSVELGDLLEDIVAGRSLVGLSRAPKAGELAVLKVSAVSPNGFRPSESKPLLDQGSFMPEHSIRAGDLLISRANTRDLVGLTALVDRDYPNLMATDKTLKLVPLENVSTRTLFHALQTFDVRRQIMSLATGTGSAMKNLSQAKVRQLRVRYPVDEHDAAVFERQMVALSVGMRHANTYCERMIELRSDLTNALLGGGS
jgi:type I restriction enzyme S subunit